MLGVNTDEKFDTAAGMDANGNCLLSTCGAGNLDADGATGGVENLQALALGPNVPCNTPASANLLQSPCTANVPGYSIFDAWLNLPSSTGKNVGRLAVARGEEIFNNANLTIPAGGIPGLSGAPGATVHCTTCHAKSNMGNNPDATFFARIGTDSVQILTALAAADSRVQILLDGVKELPDYCLRPISDPTPFSTKACGQDATDVETTDPARAMVTGKIADVGKFKPPILRGIAARSPYFHAGLAVAIDDVINFYNARFSIGLTDAEHLDLASFLEAQ
jgi:hypothetical protein